MAIYSNVSGVGAGLIKGVDGISINKIRSINAALSSAFALLLDESYGSGAEAAYSVRRISGVYNGPLMVIRRDSDDATLEVGFNSSNDIDSSAIEVHCAGTTCYVTEWRDQSSNGNDATQGIETNQPTIYTGGALVKENGKVALDFDNDRLRAEISATITSESVFVTTTIDNSGRWNRIVSQAGTSGGDSGSYIPMIQQDSFGIIGGFDGSFRSGVEFDYSTQLLFSALNTGSSLTNYVSGTAGTSSTYALNETIGTLGIGDAPNGGTSGEKLVGNMQEVVVYHSDKSTDRTSIESNIGDYYTQNTPLLDTYTGSAAAYSLRKLSSSYSGPLIRVREDGGDTQADIYANVFGELDTVSLAAHCGSNNGFVVSWLDQSGSSNTATQPADANQPKIYDGTTGVVTENGKVAVDFDGNDVLDISITQAASDYTCTFVNKNLSTSSFLFDTTSGRLVIEGRQANFGAYYDGSWKGTAASSTTQILRTIIMASPSSGAAFTNGSQIDTGLSYTQKALGGTTRLGDSIVGSRNINGTLQEFILWTSDQSSNRTNIESNINNFYDIFPGTELIDEYSGAAAAYSLRSLSEQYDGAVVTVRRDSDDAQKNIYTLSDGQIDTNALEGFCGKSDGFVVRWFDQSSNSNNATQPADANQPKIYDGTTGVVTENGKPAVQFIDTSSTYLSFTSFAPSSDFSVIFVAENGANNNDYMLSGGAASLLWASSTTQFRARIQFAFYDFSTSIGSGSQYLGFLNRASNSLTFAADSNLSTSTFTTSNALALNSLSYGGLNGYNFKMSEVILYASDQSANRTGIEENINENYLIYQPRTSPTSGLLADYSGAAAAYSLRQLSNKAVMAVKVRRDSDDAQIAIGFVGGDLDTAALSNFCGTSDGFVVEWVDQSTNGNHATQPADTQQPKIYDGGSQRVITENGKPAVFFEADIMDFTLPSMTEGEVFRVLRAANDPPASSAEAGGDMLGTGWNSGARSHYPWLNGNIYDSTGRNARLSFNPTANIVQQHLLNILSKTGEWTARINGTQEHTTSSNTVGFRTSNSFGQVGTAQLKHHYQEFILWPTDQSSNRTNIEDNIFSHYSPAPLLDTYSGAAAAYSLRKLSSSATNAVQVRRDSDDATQYIGFVQDVFNGESLDTAALSAFCGSANGFVTEWVDQSSNSNNATQAIAPAQPKIYDGGSQRVVTENGKPAVDFLNAQFFDIGSTQWTDGEMLQTIVFRRDSGNDTVFDSGAERLFYESIEFGFIHYGTTPNATKKGSSPANSQLLVTCRFDNSSADLYENGLSVASNTGIVGNMSTASGTATLGARSATSGQMDGRIQEFIHWPSNQSSNRTNIESNINTFYDIY